MPYYCLTIRRCTPVKTESVLQKTVEFYEAYMRRLKDNDPRMELEYHYENVLKKNGSNNVHVHAMIKAAGTPHITYKKGYSIKLEKCGSATAWRTYITKSQITKEDILNIYKSINEATSDEDSVISIDTVDYSNYPRIV